MSCPETLALPSHRFCHPPAVTCLLLADCGLWAAGTGGAHSAVPTMFPSRNRWGRSPATSQVASPAPGFVSIFYLGPSHCGRVLETGGAQEPSSSGCFLTASHLFQLRHFLPSLLHRKHGKRGLFFEKLNTELPYGPGVPLRKDPRDLKAGTQILTARHTETIHNSQKVETVQVSTHREMNNRRGLSLQRSTIRP